MGLKGEKLKVESHATRRGRAIEANHAARQTEECIRFALSGLSHGQLAAASFNLQLSLSASG